MSEPKTYPCPACLWLTAEGRSRCKSCDGTGVSRRQRRRLISIPVALEPQPETHVNGDGKQLN